MEGRCYYLQSRKQHRAMAGTEDAAGIQTQPVPHVLLPGELRGSTVLQVAHSTADRACTPEAGRCSCSVKCCGDREHVASHREPVFSAREVVL